ncbi:MAG: ATP synthase F1 subunit gamma [Mangrovibacterium sp.]
MANLKEIQTRIGSVKTTRQVTSAMKMVSAAKLKKAQDNITRMRPYAEKLLYILAQLGEGLNSSESPYTEQRPPENVLLVIASTNKGLCGGFNSNITKAALTHAKTKYPHQYRAGKVHFFVVGKQVVKLLKSRKIAIEKEDESLIDELTFEHVSNVANELMEMFRTHKYDRVDLVYNKFINAAVQQATIEQFLPLTDSETVISEEKHLISDFIFEPSKEEIITKLIPQALQTLLFKVLVDSQAAEHGARMTAMTQATDNASELIQDLTLTFNKVRQAAITNQIIEVTGGAEALN